MLPARLGDLIESMAEVLEVHTEALELQRRELTPRTRRLSEAGHRAAGAAARLRAIGDEMAGYRDLPIGTHDPAAMTSPKAVGAFEEFVAVEEQLLTMLEARVPQDRQMLDEMRRAAG